MLRLTKDETWSILFREWKKGTENILTARHFKVRCFKSSAQLTAKLLNLRPCTIRASPSSRLGPGSSVGIATELRAGRSGDRVPVGARFSAPVQTGPGAHPASCTMGTGSFPGVKSGRGVTLSPHPLIVSWSRKSRAIPLLPLWAVRLVQSLSACTRVLEIWLIGCHVFKEVDCRWAGSTLLTFRKSCYIKFLS